MKRLALLSAAALLASAIQASAQTYTYIDLGVSPYTDTFATSATSDVQAGYGLVGGQPQALIWQDTPGSVIALPSSGYQSTKANSVYGTLYAVGSGVTTGGQTVGLLWNSFTQAPVNLNPSFASSSVLNSISAFGSVQEAGSATLTTTGQQVAVSWGSTASTATNLNPSGATSSQAYATAGFGTGEAGSAVFSGVTHAIYWETGVGPIDLHPTGALRSEALGLYYLLSSSPSLTVEVGDYTTSSGAVHACYWSGTPDNMVDIHPATGYTSTVATGIVIATDIGGAGQTVYFSGTIVGYGTRTDGTTVPLAWNIYESSHPATDLSTYLPAGTTSSKATGIDNLYNTITGTALINGSNHAFILGVAEAPTFLTAPQSLSTIVNVPYSYQVVARGIPAPTYSATSLPPGLSISSTTGLITGTPTQIGSFVGHVSATSGSFSQTQVCTIKVVAAPAFQMNLVGSLVPANGTGLHQTLVRGTDGNFYGTSTTGGAGGNGTVYEMTPGGTQTTIHAFGDNSVTNDGVQPMGLSFGTDGTLYGTTYAGGSAGKGTVFNINQGTTTILHNFAGGTSDGANPANSLVQAPDGNFYGVTQYGGTRSQGTFFSMTPSGNLSTPYSFGSSSTISSGLWPNSPLIQDPNFRSTVSLYGATLSGISSRGTVYAAGPSGVTGVVKSLDVTIPPLSGFWPHGPLMVDSTETIYGIASAGGISSDYNNATSDPTNYNIFGIGAIYKLSGNTETDLHDFGDGTVGNDGSNTSAPNAPLVKGIDGNLYGVTPAGGSANQGCLFQINPTTNAMLVLHSFGDGTIPNDGQVPGPVFFQGTDGYFYGVTEQGGANGNGAIYQFSVNTIPTVTPPTQILVPLVGVPYNYALSATNGSGFPAPTFAIASGALPPGLSLSVSGVISGTATATGTYHIFATATNGAGTSATQLFLFNVQQLPTFTNGPPPNGTAYTFAYNVTAVPTSITYSVSGSQPPGLTFSGNAVSGTPTTSGVYTGTVTATNVVGTASQPYTIVISDTYTSWANAKFTVAELQDTTYSGPSATPQNDGVSNLLKFLYDINPAQPMGTNDLAALPVVATETDAGVQYLTLTYRQSQTASGLTVNVQTSTDLTDFQTASLLDLNENVGTDPNTGDPIIKVGVKTNGVPKLFIRLNVTSP